MTDASNQSPHSALSHHADCDASACVYECPVAAEVDGLMALSGAIRTLRERGWTVEPPAGTWRGNAPVHEATGHPLGTCMECQEFHLATVQNANSGGAE